MFRKYVFGLAMPVMALLVLVSLTYAQEDVCHGDTCVVARFVEGDTCHVPPGDYRTQTRGGWCVDCHGQNPGCIRDTYFPSVFPSGLTIGGTFTLHLSTATTLKNFMAATPHGTPGILTASLTDPTSSPAGVFAKQLVALALNIGFGDAAVPSSPPFSDIGGLFLMSGPFGGWTVDQVFALANTVIGGNTAALPPGTSVSDLNDAVDGINNNFVNGTVSQGWLCPTPPEPPCPEMPPMLVEIGHHFCLEFCGVPIKVYWCCPFAGQPVFSWVPGCLGGGAECNSDCTPYEGPLRWTAQWDSSNSDCPAPGGWWSAEFTAEGSGCVCVFFDEQLSVELLDFAAVADDRSVTLRWSTASEHDNDYFEIFRNGHLLHRQSSVGNSPSRTDYAWVDASDLSVGTTYDYALNAVDISGNRLSLGTESVTLSGSNAVTSEFALEQNYPNPFNPVTTIAFSLAEKSPVKLAVYDLTGREVASLVNEERNAGRYEVTFNAGALPTGMYFYRLQAGSFAAVRKLILMK
jgi:hypothetical protein